MITDDQFNALLARVNSIDGLNLPNPADSQLHQLSLEIAGLRTTIRQVSLVLEADLKDLKTSVANLQRIFNQFRGATS